MKEKKRSERAPETLDADEQEFIRQISGTPKQAPNQAFIELVKKELSSGLEFDEAFEKAKKSYSNRINEARKKTTAAKDSGRSVTDNSLLTKMMLSDADTGEIVLGQREGQAAIARAESSYALSLIEYNILRSIVSYQLDTDKINGGEITLSASQIYNKMRRGSGAGKVNKTQQAEIHKYMLGLERRVKIWMNDPALSWLNMSEERIRNMRLLHFDYDEGYINGQRTEFYYTIYNVGLLQEIAYRAGQLERIPQELLAIQEEKTPGNWCGWTLSEKRIKIRTILELFIFQNIRARAVGRLVSNKKPYSDIFEQIPEIKTREHIKRAKNDVSVILNYWTEKGLIDSWNEYGKSRGIEIKLKGGAE